jgi:methionyl-tRNA formyltransferase
MRVVLLTNGSSNQVALANRLHQRVDLVGVVISKNIPKKKKVLTPVERLAEQLRRVQNRTVGRPYAGAWFALQSGYAREFTTLPNVPQEQVPGVNDDATLRFIERHKPDLVVVSGTNMVGSAVIRLGNAAGGIWNLHTGISPYVKGGPNCTNWCLAKGWYHLIGNTIMWIDLGIDTGDLLATERTPLEGDESLKVLHRKVMDHAHDLYVRAVECHAHGKPVARVPQASLGAGDTFYTKEWNGRAMARGLLQFRTSFGRRALRGCERDATELTLVDLPR